MTLSDKIKRAKEKLVYSFIPVNSHKIDDYVKISEFNQLFRDDEELFSGSISCSMYALSPLIVGNITTTKNKGKEDEHTIVNPLEITNKIHISPHSLKGAIASFVKSYLNVPIRKFNNQSFFMRPNIKIYNKIFTNKDKKRFITGAGIVTKVLKDSMEILPIDGMLKFDDSGKKNISVNPFQSFKESDVNRLVETRVKTNSGNQAFFFFQYPDGWAGDGITVDKFIERDKENSSKLKHHNCIGFTKSKFEVAINFNDHLKLKVNQEIITHYNKTIEELGSGFINKHPFHFSKDEINLIKDNLKKNRDFIIGEPIIFQYDVEKDEIISFGKNFYYLWLYQNSLEDAVKHNLNDDFFKIIDDEIRISRFYEMFGFTQDDMFEHERLKDNDKDKNSKSGKIHFNYARHVSGGSIDKEGFELKRPGQPMPSAYEFYLKQDSSSGIENPLNTYGDRAREDCHKAVISGRKIYRCSIKNPIPLELCPEEKKMRICLKKVVKPHKTINNLDSFPEFKFKLNYNNLTQEELSLLCFSLQLDDMKKENLINLHDKEEILCHQIGYGKNYGMGAVKIYIDQLDAFDSNLNRKSFNYQEMISSHSFENKDELKKSLKLYNREFSYPEINKEITKWHSEIRSEDFELRQGHSEKSLFINKPKPHSKEKK